MCRVIFLEFKNYIYEFQVGKINIWTIKGFEQGMSFALVISDLRDN
jgi:hypothetical protein